MTHRNILTGIVLLFIFAGIFAQDVDLNKYDQEGKKTGIWETYYESGKVKSRGTFREGHPIGELSRYYPGGLLQANMNFDETGRVSYVKMYYETGNLASEGKYIDQQKDSIWNYFSAYDNQKVISETYLLGKKDGVSYKFYSNGKISENQQWQNNQKHGIWEQYFDSGQIRLSGSFSSGLLNGGFTSYNTDGSLSITGSYLNGAMDGIWNYYNETGQPDLRVEYKNGKMLPNPEMEKRTDEFSKKIKEAIGNLDDIDIKELK